MPGQTLLYCEHLTAQAGVNAGVTGPKAYTVLEPSKGSFCVKNTQNDWYKIKCEGKHLDWEKKKKRLKQLTIMTWPRR